MQSAWAALNDDQRAALLARWAPPAQRQGGVDAQQAPQPPRRDEADAGGDAAEGGGAEANSRVVGQGDGRSLRDVDVSIVSEAQIAAPDRTLTTPDRDKIVGRIKDTMAFRDLCKPLATGDVAAALEKDKAIVAVVADVDREAPVSDRAAVLFRLVRGAEALRAEADSLTFPADPTTGYATLLNALNVPQRQRKVLAHLQSEVRTPVQRDGESAAAFVVRITNRHRQAVALETSLGRFYSGIKSELPSGGGMYRGASRVLVAAMERQLFSVLTAAKAQATKEGDTLSEQPLDQLLDAIMAGTIYDATEALDSLHFHAAALVLGAAGVFVSKASRNSLISKFKELNLHKRRTSIEQLAKELNPMIRGILNYFHKFSNQSMRFVWNQLNARLLKWVKWENGLYKYASVRWLKARYKKTPRLFSHWLLVHP